MAEEIIKMGANTTYNVSPQNSDRIKNPFAKCLQNSIIVK